MSDETQKSGVECACRKALEEVRTHYPKDYSIRITEIIDAALATPCECAKLREERDTARKGMDDLEAECEYHATDRATLHRWFPAMFGEVMDGRDFAVKCEMASREITKLRAELAAANERAEKAEGVVREVGDQLEFDHDRFRQEFAEAFREIKAAVAPLHTVTANWGGCPRNAHDVAQARIDLKRQRDAARKDLAVAVEALRVYSLSHNTHRWREAAAIVARFDAQQGRD